MAVRDVFRKERNESKPLLMIGGLALAIGLLVSFAVYNRLRTVAGSNRNSGVPVVVAADDIAGWSQTRRPRCRRHHDPAVGGPSGSILIRTGRPWAAAPFCPSAKANLFCRQAGRAQRRSRPALMIPPGMRAVSVRVNDVVSVAGFVQPGTRVDVMATTGSGQTTTVLENVAVIAVGKSLARRDRCAIRPGDYPAGFSRRRAKTGAGFAGRTDSAVFAQSARHQAGRHRRDPDQFAVPGENRWRPSPSPKPTKSSQRPLPGPTAPYQVEMIRGNKREEKKFDPAVPQ
jgi:hypothetical protein